jgi:hypothetical protein
VYVRLCVLPFIVARQRLGKSITVATNTHATIELFGRVFFYVVRVVLRKVGDWVIPDFPVSFSMRSVSYEREVSVSSS